MLISLTCQVWYWHLIRRYITYFIILVEQNMWPLTSTLNAYIGSFETQRLWTENNRNILNKTATILSVGKWDNNPMAQATHFRRKSPTMKWSIPPDQLYSITPNIAKIMCSGKFNNDRRKRFPCSFVRRRSNVCILVYIQQIEKNIVLLDNFRNMRGLLVIFKWWQKKVRLALNRQRKTDYGRLNYNT